nr:selenium-binding family protein [Rhizobium sp. BK399]
MFPLCSILLSSQHCRPGDFGEKYQLVFEPRPAHDPTKAYGFVNSVLSLEDLSSSIWVLRRDGAKMGGHQNDRYPGGTRRSWRAVSAL